MIAKNIPQNYAKSKSRFTRTIIILSNGEWVYVPRGVDPDACRHQHETRLRETAATPALALAAA